MNHIIYYRKSQFTDELSDAQQYFKCVDLLTNIDKDSFIISRYSMFPFPADQEREIKNLNCKLINSHHQHTYIAELMNYVEDLKELTPKTYYSLQELPEDGQFILKGATNSKKNKWNQLMFAPTKKKAIEIHSLLQEDGLIGQQHIYIRDYIPLVTYTTGLGGVPITKEFRFFVAYGEILCGAYYWSNFSSEIEIPSIDEVPQEFLQEAINRIGDRVNFYALDVAQKQDGNWIVVELNDGCWSGLSDNNSNVLYSRLKEVLIKKGI